MKEYDFLTAVDVVIGYHRDLAVALAAGVPVKDYPEIMAQAHAAREILRRFADVLDEYDRSTYLERLKARLDAMAEMVFFQKIEGVTNG